MTPEQENQRGQQAERLLADPLLVEAFETIEQEITQQWITSPARDADGREKLWMMQQMLYRVKGHLDSVVESGKLARATLAQRMRGRNTSLL